MADDVLVFKKKIWEKKWEKVKKTERKKKTKKNPLLYLEATYSPDFKHIRKNKNTVSDDYVHLNFSPLSVEDVDQSFEC